MKVGTDGVLLGAWAKCENALNILDIGTGTGLIALMMSQRSQATIDAIEIDRAAFGEALFNITNSRWSDRIQVFRASLKEYSDMCLSKYDLIVSNPPYFSKSLLSPHKTRTLARHDSQLTLPDLFKGMEGLLTDAGTIQLILPEESHLKALELSQNFGFYCVEKVWVKPTPKKAPKRVLLEFSRSENPIIEQELIIEDGGRHQYSDAYKQLTREYYLAF